MATPSSHSIPNEPLAGALAERVHLNVSSAPAAGFITATDAWPMPLRRCAPLSKVRTGLLDSLRRRWRRERRRRAVGRAYDMALEIVRVIPSGSDVLDVGCGNGFIAHHLSAMTGGHVAGIDLGDHTQAPSDIVAIAGLTFLWRAIHSTRCCSAMFCTMPRTLLLFSTKYVGRCAPMAVRLFMRTYRKRGWTAWSVGCTTSNGVPAPVLARFAGRWNGARCLNPSALKSSPNADSRAGET